MADEGHLDLPADVDRLLRETMAAEPSTGFLPRVRERIAAQPRSDITWWRVTSACGAGAVALALVVLGTSAPAPVVEPTVPTIVSARPVVASEPPLAVEPIGGSGSADRASGGAPSLRGRTLGRTMPTVAPLEMATVIVDGRQRAALVSMMRLMEEGKVTKESFVPTTPESAGAIEDRVIPVGVRPVEVSPILVGGVLQFGSDK